MLHSSDRSKDFSYKHTGKYERSFHSPTFYKIADLEKNGFIHPDGSLRFEFSIKRHQFERRAITAEKEANKKVKNLMSLVKSLCPP